MSALESINDEAPEQLIPSLRTFAQSEAEHIERLRETYGQRAGLLAELQRHRL